MVEMVRPKGCPVKVIRKNVSEYQGNSFKQFEKEHLEIIPEVEYLWSETLKEEDDGDIVLITTSQTKLEDITPEELERTKLLIHPNSGYDNLSLDFLKQAQFPVIVGNPIRAHAVTNYILTSLFKHFNPFSHQEEWDTSREWNRSLLNQQNVLLIGYGHIGKLVESSIKHLVGSLSIYDPDKGLNDLKLEGIDVVIVAASLNPTSQGMIDKAFLKSLKPNFVLINPARGKIVNQIELMEVLTKQKAATAYLDVFETEPFNKIDFLGINNIIATSHIAGVYKNLNSEIVKFEFEVLNKYIQGRTDMDKFLENFKDLDLRNRIRGDYLL